MTKYKFSSSLLLISSLFLLIACSPTESEPVAMPTDELPGITAAPVDTATPQPTATPEPTAPPVDESVLPWWNDEVFYEVFVRSFYDSDGDGIGDLQGLISRLDYLNDGNPETINDLGVTALWLMPVAQSPSYHGYDVIDYRTIEEDYGTNDDFRQLIDEAHQRGIKVIVDLVLNHTSTQHPWFIESKQVGSEFEDWYLWEAENPGFVGPWGQGVWHQANGRYYYGVFWEGMPDLNYENPDVTAQIQEVSRFWLEEMNVDGFRLDAVKHLIEAGEQQEGTPATHDWLEGYHDFVKSINPEALMVGEIWSSSSNIAPYIGDEVDIAFEFTLADTMLDSVSRSNSQLLTLAQKQMLETYPPGQYAAFLSNHDQTRVATRLIGKVDSLKVAASLLLTNPGVPFIYYGEEIGMTGGKPDERIRTPMQWDTTPDSAGFTTGNPWQPLAGEVELINVAEQSGDPDSLLSHYRALIHLRNAHPALRAGDFIPVKSDKRSVYSFIRHYEDDLLLVVINLGKKEVDDYSLSLDEGSLSSEMSPLLVMGNGKIADPSINADGGFEEYRPLGVLPPQSTFVIQYHSSN